MMDEMHEGVWAAIAVAIIALLLGLVGESDYQEALSQQQIYCDQVAKHRQSGGEFGWPDYRQSAAEECE
jgi:hypothetical protein